MALPCIPDYGDREEHPRSSSQRDSDCSSPPQGVSQGFPCTLDRTWLMMMINLGMQMSVFPFAVPPFFTSQDLKEERVDGRSVERCWEVVGTNAEKLVLSP